uniref:Uncharacterized protein n=1 Tax=Gasterosteus aculeatus TaxID=69293 RepID=G3NGW1_GASAC
MGSVRFFNIYNCNNTNGHNNNINNNQNCSNNVSTCVVAFRKKNIHPFQFLIHSLPLPFLRLLNLFILLMTF